MNQSLPASAARAIPRFVLGSATLLALAASGCQREGAPARARRGFARAEEARAVPLASARALGENSSAAVSIATPGVIYGVNDSGNDAVLFAFDTTGADRGRWRLQGANNRDWEAVAVARCEAGGDRWCVFVGDVGDNAGDRDHVTIYRVAEPATLEAGAEAALVPDVLTVRYTDGPHNVESMVVGNDGAVLLVTKESARATAGFVRPTLVYRVAPPAWGGGGSGVATLVDSLPIVPGVVSGQAVTDAALTPDGQVLAVRTYRALVLFATDPATALRLPERPPVVCDLSALREAQGEGVGLVGVTTAGAGRFAFTSEGKREPLRLATCPLPPR